MFALQKAIHAMEGSNQIAQVSAIKRGSTTICVPQFRKVESETERTWTPFCSPGERQKNHLSPPSSHWWLQGWEEQCSVHSVVGRRRMQLFSTSLQGAKLSNAPHAHNPYMYVPLSHLVCNRAAPLHIPWAIACRKQGDTYCHCTAKPRSRTYTCGLSRVQLHSQHQGRQFIRNSFVWTYTWQWWKGIMPLSFSHPKHVQMHVHIHTHAHTYMNNLRK